MLSGCRRCARFQGGEHEPLGLLCGAADQAALRASDGDIPAHRRLAQLLSDGAEASQQAIGLLEVASLQGGACAEKGGVSGKQRIVQPIGQLTGFLETTSKFGQRLWPQPGQGALGEDAGERADRRRVWPLRERHR